MENQELTNNITPKKYIDFLAPTTNITDISIAIKDSDKSMKAREKADLVMKGISTFITYLLLCFMALIVIFPFYWMIITSLKGMDEIRNNVQTFFPNVVMWANYIDVFKSFTFGTYLRNTIIIGAFSTLGTLLTTILAAFAFAKLKFAGRDALFMVFLATMMIPGEMMVLTNYITVSRFGWVGGEAIPGGNYLAMIIPFLISISHIYLLRQNFRQIPNELYYAAKVDGVGDWKYLWKIMVPMAKSSIITIVILKLMGAWNSYVWPNLVASDKYRLITNGLRSAFSNSDTGDTQFHLQMAATIIVTLPLLIVFIFFRKYIMSGVSRSGIKG